MGEKLSKRFIAHSIGPAFILISVLALGKHISFMRTADPVTVSLSKFDIQKGRKVKGNGQTRRTFATIRVEDGDYVGKTHRFSTFPYLKLHDVGELVPGLYNSETEIALSNKYAWATIFGYLSLSLMGLGISFAVKLKLD